MAQRVKNPPASAGSLSHFFFFAKIPYLIIITVSFQIVCKILNFLSKNCLIGYQIVS